MIFDEHFLSPLTCLCLAVTYTSTTEPVRQHGTNTWVEGQPCDLGRLYCDNNLLNTTKTPHVACLFHRTVHRSLEPAIKANYACQLSVIHILLLLVTHINYIAKDR